MLSQNSQMTTTRIIVAIAIWVMAVIIPGISAAITKKRATRLRQPFTTLKRCAASKITLLATTRKNPLDATSHVNSHLNVAGLFIVVRVSPLALMSITFFGGWGGQPRVQAPSQG
jgi:hypothetical protein